MSDSTQPQRTERARSIFRDNAARNHPITLSEVSESNRCCYCGALVGVGVAHRESCWYSAYRLAQWLYGDWIVGSINWSGPLTKRWDPRVDWWLYTKLIREAIAQGAPIPTPAGYRQVGTMFVATEPDDDGTYEAVAIERFGDPEAHRPGPLSGPVAFWAGRPPGGWEK